MGACNIDILRNPSPPLAAATAADVGTAPSAPVRQVSHALTNMVSPMGSPSSTTTTTTQPVPVMIVPALPAPHQVQSVIPPTSYLATANILSEISRRRVSVELSMVQAAQKKAVAAPTSTARQREQEEKEQQEQMQPQQDQGQFYPTLEEEDWLIDDIIENIDWGDAE